MSQRSKLATIMLACGVVVIVSFVTVFFMGMATTAANRDLLRYRAGVDHLQAVLSALKDTETGQRGYLLTGDEAYLQPYKQGVSQTRLELGRQAKMEDAGDLQTEDVTHLSRLTPSRCG